MSQRAPRPPICSLLVCTRIGERNAIRSTLANGDN